MRPTETLIAEHHAIEAMLGATRGAAQRLANGDHVDPQVFAEMVDFYANFADRCHHAKEERILFPRLAERGIPVDGGPIGVMLAEHEEGRAHIRGMRQAVEGIRAGDRLAVEKLIEHALGYADLLAGHIRKENVILFPMADRALTEADEAELGDAFERIEAEEMGEGVHERYHRMIHGYVEQYAL
ncbi:MAG: hemerythrin domain-containing protein [Chloroflexota bacterium]